MESVLPPDLQAGKIRRTDHPTSYHSKNQNQIAQKYILSAIEDFNQLVGTENAQLGEAYDVLAGIKIDLGEYKGALEASEKAVDILKRLADEPSHPYLNKLSNYADALSHTGNNQKALETYQYIVTEKRKLDGDTHPYMAASYYNLAVQQDNMGLNNKAIRNYEKSIKITETNFGSDAKDIAYKYHNLAAILAKDGNNQKANALFKKAGFIYEDQYSVTSLRKGSYYLDRGKFEFNEGNFKVADSLLNDALKVYSTHYSSDNPTINEINSLLASMK